MNKEVKDHKGNIFVSVEEMCKAYNIDVFTFTYRIKHGWDLKSALTKKHVSKRGCKECVDHLGNHFNSVADMCKAYKININTFEGRCRRGMSLEESLTLPNNRGGNNKRDCCDHKGNRFNSVAELCECYGINNTVLSGRMRNGWSLKEALETPIRNRKFRD